MISVRVPDKFWGPPKQLLVAGESTCGAFTLQISQTTSTHVFITSSDDAPSKVSEAPCCLQINVRELELSLWDDERRRLQDRGTAPLQEEPNLGEEVLCASIHSMSFEYLRRQGPRSLEHQLLVAMAGIQLDSFSSNVESVILTTDISATPNAFNLMLKVDPNAAIPMLLDWRYPCT
jgi:hypothetical protein